MTLEAVDTLLDVVNGIAAKQKGSTFDAKGEMVDLTAFSSLFKQDRLGHTIDILETAGL